jgi:pimeloyl-ACP methyl ester carboxylesterase
VKFSLPTKAVAWLVPFTAAIVIALSVVPTPASADVQPATYRLGQTGVKPTIVLVHGAWADGSSWDHVIPILQREGYTVDAPPNPLEGLTEDSAYLKSFLSTISGPVVLVGHSYGGAVITNTATGDANVKALVYVDGFEPAAHETLDELTFAKPGSCLAGGGNPSNVFKLVTNPSQPTGDYDLYLKIPAGTDYPGFDSCFATLVPTQEATVLGAVQRPLSLAALTSPSGTPAWLTIPSWAVIGTEDQVIPPAELTFMAERAHSRITYVRAGHLSMVTQPSAVASVIAQAAQAEG